MNVNEAYTAIFNLLWNKNPAHRNKEALSDIKAILKQVRNTGIEESIAVLEQSRLFDIEYELTKIRKLKEKL